MVVEMPFEIHNPCAADEPQSYFPFALHMLVKMLTKTHIQFAPEKPQPVVFQFALRMFVEMAIKIHIRYAPCKPQSFSPFNSTCLWKCQLESISHMLLINLSGISPLHLACLWNFHLKSMFHTILIFANFLVYLQLWPVRQLPTSWNRRSGPLALTRYPFPLFLSHCYCLVMILDSTVLLLQLNWGRSCSDCRMQRELTSVLTSILVVLCSFWAL